MAFHPYPNAERALRHVKKQQADSYWDHINRLRRTPPDADTSITIQSMIDKTGCVSLPLGEYRLSTRRPA